MADASPTGAAAASAGTAAAASPSPSGSAVLSRRGTDGPASPVATQVAAQVAAPVTPSATAPVATGGEAAAGTAAGEPAPLAVAPATSAAGSAADEVAAATAADPAGAAGLVRIKAQEDSWVEVRQADGTPLHNGLVKAGASIELKGTPPYRVVLGNASEVELAYEGKVQDLKAHTRANNIARLQLR
jgi:cytoskeleton protein RodZ